MRALLAVLTLAACGGGDDDGGTTMMGEPCVGDNPGIAVHVSVTCQTISPCTLDEPQLRITFPIAPLTIYPVAASAFDAELQATLRVEYPDNAGTGPATVAFVANLANPATHINGETNFDSYPPGCVMVDVAAMEAGP